MIWQVPEKSGFQSKDWPLTSKPSFNQLSHHCCDNWKEYHRSHWGLSVTDLSKYGRRRGWPPGWRTEVGSRRRASPEQSRRNWRDACHFGTQKTWRTARLARVLPRCQQAVWVEFSFCAKILIQIPFCLGFSTPESSIENCANLSPWSLLCTSFTLFLGIPKS